MEARMRALSAQYPHVTYINFVELVKDVTNLYEDDVHCTSKGTVITAEMVGKIIQTRYLKRGIEHWARYQPESWTEPSR
jgi:hypothetical protein